MLTHQITLQSYHIPTFLLSFSCSPTIDYQVDLYAQNCREKQFFMLRYCTCWKLMCEGTT